jgi:hypothetical protein
MLCSRYASLKASLNFNRFTDARPVHFGAGFFDAMMNKHVSAVMILLGICFPGIAGAGLKVLDGEHTVIYDIVNPASGTSITMPTDALSVLAVEQGVAGYAKDVNDATDNFQVTDSPAAIKGLSASGATRTDVVISQADAQALRQMSGKNDFLQYCKIIIVY